jgi:hypothetical protein
MDLVKEKPFIILLEGFCIEINGLKKSCIIMISCFVEISFFVILIHIRYLPALNDEETFCINVT